MCSPGSDSIPFPSLIANPKSIHFLTSNTCDMLVGVLSLTRSDIFPHVIIRSVEAERNNVSQFTKTHIEIQKLQTMMLWNKDAIIGNIFQYF